MRVKEKLQNYRNETSTINSTHQALLQPSASVFIHVFCLFLYFFTGIKSLVGVCEQRMWAAVKTTRPKRRSLSSCLKTFWRFPIATCRHRSGDPGRPGKETSGFNSLYLRESGGRCSIKRRSLGARCSDRQRPSLKKCLNNQLDQT